GVGHPLAMDLQSRTAEYGAGRHHAHAEIEARCLTPLLADAKNGGITNPLLVGAGSLKLPVERVRGNAVFRTHAAIDRRAQPPCTGTQPRAAHQPRHPLAAATLTPFNEVVPDPGRTVGGIALRE